MNRKYYSLAFGICLIALGVLLSIFNIGDEFLGFNSVGSYLLYTGTIAIFIGIFKARELDKKTIDERMAYNALKANRMTYVVFILFAFIVMIIDGIKNISIPYSLFMSYLIMGSVLLNIGFYYYYNRV